ncbi:MAG: CinA family protein [Bacilli bacterium]
MENNEEKKVDVKENAEPQKNDNAFELLLKKLEEKNYTLGVCESFTGGLFAKAVTDIPGASKVFKGSLVTYSSEAKVNVLGIREEDIKVYGVVSSLVASQMCLNAQKLLHSDVCVSFTGNAGPTTCPGSGEVGECYICVAIKDVFKSFHFNIDGTRNEVRAKACLLACDIILKTL